MFQKVWGIGKILCIIEGIAIFRRKLFVSQCRKTSWASLQCFRKFGVSEKFMHNRGYHNFLTKNFGLTGWKITWAFLQCFRKFGVSKKFMHNRGYHKFPSKKFCLTVPKIFVGIPSMFQKVWAIGIILCIIGGITCFRRKFFVSQCRKISWASLQWFRKFEVSKNFMNNRGYHNFPTKIFLSHSVEKFCGHPFNVSENLGYRKNLCITRGYHKFPSKFFVSQGWKISWASLQCFRKFGVSIKIMNNRGYHNFPTKIFCLTVPKIFVGIPSMFQKVWGIEKFYE